MKVLVVGEHCLDNYVYGDCPRLSPEGPVPVFIPKQEKDYDGMAGNTFVNLLNIKEEEDEIQLISNKYIDHAVSCAKTRFIDLKTNQILLRVDTNDSFKRITSFQMNEAINFLQQDRFDLLIISDYNKGFLDESDLITLGQAANLSILDSKRRLTQKVIDSFDFIKLNNKEYESNKDKFADFSNRMKVVITLGSKGVQYLDKTHAAPKELQTFDVSGAGDVFTAVMSYNYCRSQDMIEAIRIAQECCNSVIQKRGTCTYEKNMD